MAVTRQRLDRELVRRHLARSRQHAADLISAQRIRVNGQTATKTATMVERSAPIVLEEPSAGDFDYASRGGYKLAGALAAFIPQGLTVAGRNCLDAGASTGGFTDVLLRHDVSRVTAVDVGYGQLAWHLQQDERVVIMDRTNVRALTAGDVVPPPSLVVADLSFISLTTVLPALIDISGESADYVLMIKPQFEVGKERLGAKGVVSSPQLRAEAVLTVARFAQESGLEVRGVEASPLPGPSGNVEYFVWLAKTLEQNADAYSTPETHEELASLVEQAISRGPQ